IFQEIIQRIFFIYNSIHQYFRSISNFRHYVFFIPSGVISYTQEKKIQIGNANARKKVKVFNTQSGALIIGKTSDTTCNKTQAATI
ncbi:hypothetical protein, partial [Polaribacter sp.]|uniref:hypothetical protein n=1 Tax=Polaribacter sp. TaxID=1920175 RepID=UPI003F4B10C8